jgi:hypothetical protein
MTELATSAAMQFVPVSYAEKAMATLMQLHCELMNEKERRVDLFRRLMEREQALAELRMYVKLLEEQSPPAAPPGAPAAEPGARAPARRPEPRRAPVVPHVGSNGSTEGWKSW